LDIWVPGVIIILMVKDNSYEKRIEEAKEKLACHIEPPGSHAHNPEGPKKSAANAIDADGRVRLTQLTDAGG